MKTSLVLLVLVWLAFTGWTFGIVADRGLTVFDLVLAEPWAAQLFVDLVIALGLFLIWMVRDARTHGIPAWPYVIATLAVGCIGALPYLIHRELKAGGDDAATA